MKCHFIQQSLQNRVSLCISEHIPFRRDCNAVGGDEDVVSIATTGRGGTVLSDGSSAGSGAASSFFRTFLRSNLTIGEALCVFMFDLGRFVEETREID